MKYREFTDFNPMAFLYLNYKRLIYSCFESKIQNNPIKDMNFKIFKNFSILLINFRFQL